MKYQSREEVEAIRWDGTILGLVSIFNWISLVNTKEIIELNISADFTNVNIKLFVTGAEYPNVPFQLTVGDWLVIERGKVLICQDDAFAKRFRPLELARSGNA